MSFVFFGICPVYQDFWNYIYLKICSLICSFRVHIYNSAAVGLDSINNPTEETIGIGVLIGTSVLGIAILLGIFSNYVWKKNLKKSENQ